MMDRGFFKTEIIKLLESMGINFIMPAVRNERIKRMLNEFTTSLLYIKWDQRVYLFSNSKKEGSREEEDRPIEKCIAFVTNIKFNDSQRIVDSIPDECNWGIES